MRVDVETEKLLYQITDIMAEQDRREVGLYGEYGDGGEIEIRPISMNRIMTSEGIQHVNTCTGRIEGTCYNQPFSAFLQVLRSKQNPMDIAEIGWFSDDPESLKPALSFFENQFPVIDPDVPKRRIVSSNAKHCWTWSNIFVAPINSTPDMIEFNRWLEENIDEDTLRFLMGRSTIDGPALEKFDLRGFEEVPVICGVSVTDLAVEYMSPPKGKPAQLYGQVRQTPSVLRHKIVDVPTYIAINHMVAAGIRQEGISIHSYHDDEGLGLLPVNDQDRERLKQAQQALHGWLQDRHGDRLEVLLDRVEWSFHPMMGFVDSVVGTGDLRLPVGAKGLPPISQFLPFNDG